MDSFRISEEQIRSAKSFWEPRYSRELSDDEAREITKNLLIFFEVLMRADGRESSCEDISSSGQGTTPEKWDP